MPSKTDLETPEAAITKDMNSESGADADEGDLSTRREAAVEKVLIAASESKKVGYLRVILILVLLGVAASISFAVFYTGSNSEKEEFERVATEACSKVVSSFQDSANRRLGAISGFANSISINAAESGHVWPNVTVPHFEEQATQVMQLADMMSLTLLTVVTKQTAEGWLEYSGSANGDETNAGWFEEALAYQESIGTLVPEDSEIIQFTASIVGPPSHTINTFLTGVEDGDKPTNISSLPDDVIIFPWWQFAPLFPFSSIVNYDAATAVTRMNQLQAIVDTREPAVGEATDMTNTSSIEVLQRKVVLDLYLQHWQHKGKQYHAGPVSDLYYPVFDRTNHGGGDDDDDDLVAVLTAYVYWQIYFENILPKDTPAVIAVLEEACGTESDDELFTEERRQYHTRYFSFVIQGDVAEFVGADDHHDPKYDYLEESTGYNAFLEGKSTSANNNNNNDGLLRGQCVHRVHVYPTEEMENEIRTDSPRNFMLIVLATFAITCLVFVAYDYWVERRQKIVLTKAIKSTEVVQNLFPETVRGRLFEDGKEGKSTTGGVTQFKKSASKDFDTSLLDPNGDMASTLAKKDMVADLHQDCTVYFADLAGFTKWSAEREPSEVFELLETLYASFDKIAKRRSVFKIETIGDCYLAVTGLPRAQVDHAVRMARFAAECVEAMNKLVQGELSARLGLETSELKLRVGLHSGPVTAGVLRGERARYQVFGDTVNTASRMESNGIPGLIQCSEATADYLRAAGKNSWLNEREGGVEAKGKGTMRTFFVQPKKSTTSARSSVTSNTSVDGLESVDGSEGQQHANDLSV